MNRNIKENSGFENFIKDSVENYEVEYNPSHWSEMNQMLDKTTIASNNKGNWFISSGLKLTVAIGLISAGLIYYNSTKETPLLVIDNENKEQINIENSSKKEINFKKEIIVDSNNKNEIHNENLKEEPNYKLNESSSLSIIKSEQNSIQHIVDDFQNNELETKDVVKQQLKSIPTISSNFAIEKLSNCELIAQFTVEKPEPNYSYDWDFGDGETSKTINPVHKYKSEGKYNVVLQVTSKENIKPLVSKRELILDPIIAPGADFEYKAFNSGSLNYGAEFISKNSTLTEYTWDFGDNQFSYEKTPRHIYFTKGNYQVKLIAKNQYGCTDTVSKMVLIEENNPLLAPNVFSPDGDGLNDNFIPKALILLEYPFEMLIYDRSGYLLYRTNDANKPWDGRNLKSSDDFSSGTTFLWVVNIKNMNGEDKSYFGNVTIIK
ncbi:MAG: PKD domain-containing protein [Bacteroidota bacterium]|nr:PKD domain-containing protein [Bacteroidota bacterium]